MTTTRMTAMSDGNRRRRPLHVVQARAVPQGQETGYGLGWDLETVALLDKQTTVVGHDGDSLAGF